jgi:hypothetical protein
MNDVLNIPESYNAMRAGIVEVLKAARATAARNVNSIMTAAYWKSGDELFIQNSEVNPAPDYGKQLIEQLAADLSRPFGRGFGSTTSPRCVRSIWPGPNERFVRRPLTNPQVSSFSMR